MIEKKELTDILFQKTSDVDREEYIIEGLDIQENILFMVIGNEVNKKISIEFGSELMNYKADLSLFSEKVEEAMSLVGRYLDSL